MTTLANPIRRPAARHRRADESAATEPIKRRQVALVRVTILARALLAVLVVTSLNGGERANRGGGLGTGARQIGLVRDPRIHEASGLAPTRSTGLGYWIHNDSGDEPRLFLIAPTGGTRTLVDVQDAKAHDWEDIASFELDGAAYLAIADTGDNDAVRPVSCIYIVREPDGKRLRRNQRLSVEPAAVLEFRYADGPRDCEAMAVDARRRTVLLVEKTWAEDAVAGVYELPLVVESPHATLIAARIGALPIQLATACDVSPNGRRLVIGTYGDAFEYDCGPRETWRDALLRRPRVLSMPWRKQGETICYAADGRSLVLTSEGIGQPLWALPCPALPDEESEPSAACSLPLPAWAARLWGVFK